MPPEILADQALARRLERAEGTAGARFVEARGRYLPESGAEWIEVAGAYAMFDGVHSPATQTFGLGLFQMPAAADMDKLEAFFTGHGAPVFHEVSPIAPKPLLAVLNERGYQPVELTSLMYMPLADRPPRQPRGGALRVRVVAEDDRDVWARTAAEGWREETEFDDVMLDLLRVMAVREDAPSFLVEWDGRPIAAGGLAVHDGVALLAGASTIPEFRHRGAQGALLESRLDYAAGCGCDLAMMGAEPGSASQRNAQRQGFRIAYTRIKWCLKAGPPRRA